MATVQFKPNRILQVVVDGMSTGTDGQVFWTEKGNQYVVDSTGKLIKITDMIIVDALPTGNQQMGKIYFLTSNSTINIWDGTSFKSYGSPSYILPTSSSSTLGGIKSGKDITVDSNGMVSVNTGIDPNSIVRLDSTGKIPSLNGSQLTSLTNTQVGLGNVTNDAQVKRSEMGIASGIPTLDASGKIPLAQIPITAVTVNSVANQTARLALPQLTNLQIAIQVDTSRIWGLNSNLNPAVISNWIDMGSSASNVSSVNGAIGAVTINSTTVGLGNVTNNAQVKKIASSVNGNIVTWSGTTGDTVADSGKALCTGSIVGTTDTQTLTNKDITSSTNKFAVISPSADSTSAIKTTKADGSTPITTVDSTNNKFTVNNCFGLPSLTTTQRMALTGLIGGEIVFDSTVGSTFGYDGVTWYQI